MTFGAAAVAPRVAAHDRGPLTPSSAEAPGQAPAFYRPELDVLRFFAFLAVFVAHAFPGFAEYRRLHEPSLAARRIGDLVNAGNFGVDLFFLLSAFLITELLLRERERFGRIHVGAFYARRALRIWPLYFTFLALAIYAVPRVLPGDYLAHAQRVALALFLGNWAAALYGYPHSVAAPLWSVSIEEQFYLLWPVLLARRSGAGIVRLAGLLLVLATVSRVLILDLGIPDRTVFTITFCRLDPIAVGAGTAVLLRGRRPVMSRRLRWASVAFGLASWYAASLLFEGWALLVAYPLATAGALAMLLAAMARPEGSAEPPRALLHLGRVSYGLYVFQLFCLFLVRRVLGVDIATSRPGELALVLVASLALTVVMALASYRWLERPFLRLKTRFTFVRTQPGVPSAP